MTNFLEIIFITLLPKNFDMAKNIRGFLENLFKYYFLNIIANVNFFNGLEIEYYCEYYPEITLQESLKGPYIKYVGGGNQRVFVGTVKYFRHGLMSHEIFFKIFDGPRNIFLCSIFIILFFKLKGLKHKISKPAIKEI